MHTFLDSMVNANMMTCVISRKRKEKEKEESDHSTPLMLFTSCLQSFKLKMTIFVNHKYQPDESHSRANPRVKVTCGVGEVPTIGPRKLTLYDGLHALMTLPAVPSLAMSDLGGAESSATSAPTKYRL